MLSVNARALLHALLLDLPGDHHHLTLYIRFGMTTTVDRRGEEFEVEHPEVVERLYAAVAEGGSGAVVVRSQTDRISSPPRDGSDPLPPVSLVLGWRVAGGALQPMDESEMFDAHCTDAASGEPIPPEPGVEYTSAPEVDLSSLHEPSTSPEP